MSHSDLPTDPVESEPSGEAPTKKTSQTLRESESPESPSQPTPSDNFPYESALRVAGPDKRDNLEVAMTDDSSSSAGSAGPIWEASGSTKYAGAGPDAAKVADSGVESADLLYSDLAEAGQVSPHQANPDSTADFYPDSQFSTSDVAQPMVTVAGSDAMDPGQIDYAQIESQFSGGHDFDSGFASPQAFTATDLSSMPVGTSARSRPSDQGSFRFNQRRFGSSGDAAFAATRIPPHSIESEQALLGALMLSETGYDQISDVVVESDFYQHNHRLIFRSIASLSGNMNPIDVVTVTGWLEQNAVLEEASGLHYVAALAQESPGAANLAAYAEIVRERSVLRQLIAASTEIADAAYQPEGKNSKELLDYAEGRVFSIADQTGRSSAGFRDIKSVLSNTVDRISELFESQDAITGLGTGFNELDEKTSGLQDSDLIIVAGRPSMGKTTFAMNIAEHAALAGDLPVAVFSMEMPAEQLAMRMVSSIGRVELQKLRTGNLSEQDWPRITSAISLLNQKKNVFIDDSPSLTPADVRARARRLKRDHGGLGLIVIDYLQLMRGTIATDNKTAEVGEISRSLKGLAKELEVPVVALSQLNRSLEQRTDKRPVMSDLRESGAIEQDADVIMFIYREEVYTPDVEEVKGKAEVLIRKQRNGPIGSVVLTFLGQFTRFENYSPELYASSSPADDGF